MTALTKYRALELVTILGLAAVAVHSAVSGELVWTGIALAVLLAKRTVVRDFVGRLSRPRSPFTPEQEFVTQLAAAKALATTRRRWLIAFGIWLALRLGGEVWARIELARLSRNVAIEVEAERRELAGSVRPVGAAEPREGDAAPEYERVLEHVGPVDHATWKRCNDAVRRVPGADRAALAHLARDKATDLEDVRRAVASTRCAWLVDHAPDLLQPDDRWMRAALLGALLNFEAQELAAAGHVTEAARAYVDVLRFGCDLACRDLYGYLAATSFSYEALRGLGALVVEYPRARILELAFLRDALARLDPELPSARRAIRSERLSALAWVRVTQKTPFGSAVAFGNVVKPERALYVHFLWTRDDLLKRIEAAASLEGRREREMIESIVDAEARASWDPLVSIAIPNLCHASVFEAELRARSRLVATALALELDRDREQPALPLDPLARSAVPLRYERHRVSWTIWSVGRNGTDDGGVPGEGDTGDIVLARDD